MISGKANLEQREIVFENFRAAQLLRVFQPVAWIERGQVGAVETGGKLLPRLHAITCEEDLENAIAEE